MASSRSLTELVSILHADIVQIENSNKVGNRNLLNGKGDVSQNTKTGSEEDESETTLQDRVLEILDEMKLALLGPVEYLGQDALQSVTETRHLPWNLLLTYDSSITCRACKGLCGSIWLQTSR